MRRSTGISLSLLFCVGTLTFLIKQQVLEFEEEIALTKKQINKCEEELHVLQVEWAYLNQPKRLQELAENKLGLHPGDHFQFVSLDHIGREAPVDSDPATLVHLARVD
jgi:cell division protein FtsL